MPTASPSDQIKKEIGDLYLHLERNFSKIHGKCQTEAQKKEFLNLYSAARDAFWQAQARTLADNSATVQSIRKELKDTTKQVKSSTKKLKDIVAFLNLVKEAVKLAAAVASLAATA